MQITETRILFSCDICCTKNVVLANALRYRNTKGYKPIDAYGIEITMSVFGPHCEHICVACADKAEREYIEEKIASYRDTDAESNS